MFIFEKKLNPGLSRGLNRDYFRFAGTSFLKAIFRNFDYALEHSSSYVHLFLLLTLPL